MTLSSKERGLFVVSVCSFKYAAKAPLSSLNKRINEIADIAIDNGGEPGDALAQVKGSPWRVGASSTIIGALIWNCLLTECADRLSASGAELPFFASLNMSGAEEHNQTLINKWRKGNPHL